MSILVAISVNSLAALECYRSECLECKPNYSFTETKNCQQTYYFSRSWCGFLILFLFDFKVEWWSLKIDLCHLSCADKEEEDSLIKNKRSSCALLPQSLVFISMLELLLEAFIKGKGYAFCLHAIHCAGFHVRIWEYSVQ